MILICGLGNPGSKYQNNRHNIGFKVLDRIASHYNVEFSDSKKFLGQVAQYKLGDTVYVLCKPTTYMNLSGQSVAAIKRFYNIDNENIWVIHDEIELPFGEIRTKKGGGHAGHNGLKSIDAYIGKDYHRMRLGVDRPLYKEDVSNYVLSDFSKSENVGEFIEEAFRKLLSLLGL
ncbi:MAG: aminoacyl-tRNA hydrolase [Alphaproteobacteria bacterium]|nr:MAG: aminoacyl-tRNA hydrolase [Alphaproteobacteria bacterium]